MSDPNRTPEQPDPIESNLDPRVKQALGVMADKIRKRTFERAQALEKDLTSLICEFVRGYGYTVDPFDPKNIDKYPKPLYKLKGLANTETWQGNIENLCESLYRHVAETDVMRHVQNLNAKILEIEDKNTSSG